MLGDLSSKGYEAAKSLGEINLRIMEKMMTRQLDTFNMVATGGLRNLKMITEAKGPNDMLRSQLDLAREFSESMLNESREAVKLATDTRDEYRAWFEQGVQVISEKMGKLRPAV
jgi:hypothetical protein